MLCHPTFVVCFNRVTPTKTTESADERRAQNAHKVGRHITTEKKSSFLFYFSSATRQNGCLCTNTYCTLCTYIVQSYKLRTRRVCHRSLRRRRRKRVFSLKFFDDVPTNTHWIIHIFCLVDQGIFVEVTASCAVCIDIFGTLFFSFSPEQ